MKYQYIVFLRISVSLSFSAVFSYSSLLMLISANVLKLASMDPPIHAEYFLCRSAYVLISVFAEFIAKFLIS